MYSIPSESWTTGLCTSVSAHGVFADCSSATTTVVCCTFVDIYAEALDRSLTFLLLKVKWSDSRPLLLYGICQCQC